MTVLEGCRESGRYILKFKWFVRYHFTILDNIFKGNRFAIRTNEQIWLLHTIAAKSDLEDLCIDYHYFSGWIFVIKGNWRFQKFNFGASFWENGGGIYQKSNNAVLLCFIVAIGRYWGELTKKYLIPFWLHIDCRSIWRF